MTNEEADELIAEFEKCEDFIGGWDVERTNKAIVRKATEIIKRFANKPPICGYTIHLDDSARIINLRLFESDGAPNFVAEFGIRTQERYTSVRLTHYELGHVKNIIDKLLEYTNER